MRFIQMLWRRYTLLCVLALTSLPLMIIGWTGRESLYSEYEFSPLTEPGLALVMEGIHDGVYPWQSFIKPKEKQEAEEPEEEDIEEASAAEAVTSESGNPAVEYAEAEDSTVETVESIPANAIRGGTDAIPEGVCNPVMQAEDYDVVNVAFLSPDDTEYNTDTEGIFAKTGIYFKLGSVDPTYFSDALFIGDSRTVGLCEYGSLKGNAAFLAKESINVYNILDKELWFTDNDEEGWDSTVEDALRDRTFGKIYVALGVNELGIGNTYMYYEKYRELLEMIREYQPEAVIYIQGIMHVSEDKSSSDSCRNNTVICQRNYAISTLANGHDIFYIDMNPYVCDANGDLLSDLSGDGIHLKASAYERWDRSLMENAAIIGE